jgi:hypothetical protein
MQPCLTSNRSHEEEHILLLGSAYPESCLGRFRTDQSPHSAHLQFGACSRDRSSQLPDMRAMGWSSSCWRHSRRRGSRIPLPSGLDEIIASHRDPAFTHTGTIHVLRKAPARRGCARARACRAGSGRLNAQHRKTTIRPRAAPTCWRVFVSSPPKTSHRAPPSPMRCVPFPRKASVRAMLIGGASVAAAAKAAGVSRTALYQP